MNDFLAACWWGERRRDRLARAALVPLSWLYACIVRQRNRLYDARVLASERVAVPVVSVGNIVVGGTGKTPFVMWLVGRLREAGLRTVVVSRGYGARVDSPTVVTDKPLDASTGFPELASTGARVIWIGEPRLSNVADEALLVATRSGVPVVSHPDRVRATLLAASLGPDLIVLDDGFQHRRLHRDLDIVLVEESNRYPRPLPAGPGREGADALVRADFVVGSGKLRASSMALRASPDSLVASVAAEVGEGLERLRGARVLAVAGIARPDRLRIMLEELGVSSVKLLAYDDHHAYVATDRARIVAAGAGCDLIVTTEKDLVKLERMVGFDDRLRALRLRVDIEGSEPLMERIGELVGFDAKDRRTHHHGLSGLGGGSEAV